VRADHGTRSKLNVESFQTFNVERSTLNVQWVPEVPGYVEVLSGAGMMSLAAGAGASEAGASGAGTGSGAGASCAAASTVPVSAGAKSTGALGGVPAPSATGADLTGSGLGGLGNGFFAVSSTPLANSITCP
jgi:hypothetical protein